MVILQSLILAPVLASQQLVAHHQYSYYNGKAEPEFFNGQPSIVPAGFQTPPPYQHRDMKEPELVKNNKHDIPDDVKKGFEGTVWQPITVLGKGHFGSCSIVVNKETKAFGVAKIAKKREDFLETEHSILRCIEAANGKGFAKPFDFLQGPCGKIFVQELLGPTLRELKKAFNGRFSLKCTLMIASQLLERLEFLHKNNIYYGDLKPDNICIGLGEARNTIYLIDMGLAKNWRDALSHSIGSPLLPTDKRGNKICFGYYQRNHLQPTPRDDIIALGLLMICLHLPGKVPWQGSIDYLVRAIQTPLDELCDGLPDEIKCFMEYARNLTPYDTVDYKVLQDYLNRAYDRSGFARDGKMDWSISFDGS